jgi:hypothetical protein
MMCILDTGTLTALQRLCHSSLRLYYAYMFCSRCSQRSRMIQDSDCVCSPILSLDTLAQYGKVIEHTGLQSPTRSVGSYGLRQPKLSEHALQFSVDEVTKISDDMDNYRNRGGAPWQYCKICTT